MPPKSRDSRPSFPVSSFLPPLYAWHSSLEATKYFLMGYSRYSTEFFRSFATSFQYFNQVEFQRILLTNPSETYREYRSLGEFNVELFFKAMKGYQDLFSRLLRLETEPAMEAFLDSWFGDGKKLEEFMERQVAVTRMVAERYPQAIQDVESEYGFGFERNKVKPFAETDRFLLYRVEPTDPSAKRQKRRKPLMIIPPYVLGANILAFLPGDNRSYAHAFANQGIPTYIRIMKDISKTEAVQTMECEDDTRDTQLFCERLVKEHGLPVTLNGYCQGGFSAICNLLTGKLDNLVDTLITCVSPMDGTRSTGLSGFLKRLPDRFNSLDYGTKTLPSGNKVADGRLMGWVYKLKSIDDENPLSAFYRDLLMFSSQQKIDMKIFKSAAAINYWLANERTDLPLTITEMSFASYNIPIDKDGTLPIKLFDKPLNLKRMKEKKIPWLICYGERDDLVEKETALAPTDFVDAEVTEFPKGHVAIATSWSHPSSACALHTRFGEDGKYRGPVKFHLDIEDERSKSRSA